MKENNYHAKRVYACPKCLHVVAIGKPPLVNRDEYLCGGCENRVKIEIFDSQPEYEWFKKIWHMRTWNNQVIYNVEHKKRYHFLDAIYYSLDAGSIYLSAKGKLNKKDILIKRKMSYEADITIYTKVSEKNENTKEYVFDVKGSRMKPGDRVRFNRNCQLMMSIYGLKVEVLND